MIKVWGNLFEDSCQLVNASRRKSLYSVENSDQSFTKIQVLAQPLKYLVGKCQNLTFYRWQRIERKHENDEGVSCTEYNSTIIISDLTLFRCLQCE